MPLFGSSRSRPHLSATFASQHSTVFGPGDTVELVAHLALEGLFKRRPKTDLLTAELCGTLVAASSPAKKGKMRDKREETTVLLSQCRTIWASRESLTFWPKTAATSQTGAPMVDLPVAFRMPTVAEQPLPPSFQGGMWAQPGTAAKGKERQVNGDEVASVVYKIVLHGYRKGRRVADDVIDLPFSFCPAPYESEPIPAQLFDPSEASSSRLPPDRPTLRQGWLTTSLDHRYREKLIGKQSLLVTSLSLPSMSSFRLKSSYPFRISFTTFSPPVETDFPATAGVPSDTKTWSQLPPPSLPFDLPDHKEVEVGLIRKVWTKTHGTPTEVVQRVGPALSCVADSGGGESSTTRAWYSAVELVDMDDYRARSGRGEGCRPGEKRWAVETVVVGEMVLGKGATMGIEPSFGPETARGLLACSYNLSLKVPRKGAYSDLAVESFVPLVISPAGAYLDVDPFVPPPVYARGSQADSSSSSKRDGDDSGWEDGWGGSRWSSGGSSVGAGGRKGESAVV